MDRFFRVNESLHIIPERVSAVAITNGDGAFQSSLRVKALVDGQWVEHTVSGRDKDDVWTRATAVRDQIMAAVNAALAKAEGR